jgi:hypothetical protein
VRTPAAEVRSLFLGTDGLKRVPALRDVFSRQAAPAPDGGFLIDVAESVRTRVLRGSPVDGIDDEAVVVVSRSLSAHWADGNRFGNGTPQ